MKRNQLPDPHRHTSSSNDAQQPEGAHLFQLFAHWGLQGVHANSFSSKAFRLSGDIFSNASPSP